MLYTSCINLKRIYSYIHIYKICVHVDFNQFYFLTVKKQDIQMYCLSVMSSLTKETGNRHSKQCSLSQESLPTMSSAVFRVQINSDQIHCDGQSNSVPFTRAAV